jgi:hypothetical protein
VETAPKVVDFLAHPQSNAELALDDLNGKEAAAGLCRLPRGPDFVLVGHAKSGTTALYEMLRQHPEIFLPDLKEPQFLASDLRWRFQPPIFGPHPSTLEEYLALFAAATPSQQAGEATTLYLFSNTAASSIASLNPRARIIAIFREPTSFLRSLHLHFLRTHNESERSLAKAMELEAERRLGRHVPRRSFRPQQLRYSEYVRYTDQLGRYHAAFPTEQVLALIYDDFRRANEATVRRVLKFLGVDDSVSFMLKEVNPSVAVRSQFLDDAIHRFSVGRGPFSRTVKESIKAVTPQSGRRRLLHGVQSQVARSSPPPPDDALMAELRVRLKPEVERFSNYLGRDLVTLWGYNSV